MLAEMRIKDLALIEELTLTFKAGLNVITGETGAGKSMVVEAVSLLLGAKADATRVRRGQEAAEVEGLFVEGDSERVMRRRIGSDGRSRAYINGRLATVKELAETGRALVEAHSQGGQRMLERPAERLRLLDRFGGAQVADCLAAYRRNLGAWNECMTVLAELEKDSLDGVERRRFLEWRVDELQRAELLPDEDQALEERVTRLKNLTELREAYASARRYLDEQAIDGTQSAMAEIERAVDKDGAASEALSFLRSAAADLDEAAGAVRRYIDDLAEDSGSLESLQERLFLIRDLSKKYDLSLEGLIAQLELDQIELDTLSDGGVRLDCVRQEGAEIEIRLRESAQNLSQARSAAAGKFAEAVKAHLNDLAFTRASFSVTVKDDEAAPWTATGRDQVDFLFSANAGEPVQPLATVASGGESSRVMLAVRSVFGEQGMMGTLLFDEIDAGVGGLTGVKVGEKLAALAVDRQVLCVTHLASIAAFADHHLAIRKSVVKEETRVDIAYVSGEARLSELSRLGGTLDESEVSVEHARRLLDQAKAGKR